MAQEAYKFLIKLTQNFDLVFVALCFLTQFGIIYTDLPRGFESGKILGFSIVILIGVIFIVTKLIYSHQFIFNNLNKRQWFFVLVGMLISLSFGIISTIYSEWPQVALWGNFFRNTGLIFYAQLHFLSILVIIIAQRKHLIQYLNIFLMVVLIQLPFVISNLLTLNSIEQFYSGYYVGGSFGQGNFLAGQLLSGFLISLGIYFTYGRKFIYLIVSITFAVLTFATMSTGGVVFLFLIPVVALCLWKIKFKLGNTASMVLQSLLIILLLVITTSIVWKTDEARSLYAQGAIELITKKPIIGNGLDTFLEGSKLIALGDRNVDRVHHMFLDIAYSLGLPMAIGAFLLLIAIVIVSRDSRLFLYSLPILIFLVTTVVHTKSAYHYVELSLFLGLWLVNYLGRDS